MALSCKKVTEWIEEEVSKPVEEWEEQQEEKCKKRPWYDPRKWVCWVVTVVVKVIRWVVVKVGKWVTRTVCELITIAIDLLRDIFSGLWDVIAGIFTFDWRRILDGLIKIGLGVVFGVLGLVRIIFLGDTIKYIIEEINEWRLRKYVRELLEEKYSGNRLQQIKDAIRLDYGAFGLRLDATAYRTFLDSETVSRTDPTAPNLIILNENGSINLRELCGFEFTEGFWNRKRYKIIKKGSFAGGGGGEPENPISKDELDDYINSRGSEGPPFFIVSMKDDVLDTKISTAEEKGRELGLILSFEKATVEVTQTNHIIHPGFDTSVSNANNQLDNFLATIISRTDKDIDDSVATRELCNPVSVGIFRYTDKLRGLAATLRVSNCSLPANDVSGVTYIDNVPDRIWKYVMIHELGHYFGLCHVDGLDRIMYLPKQKSWWSWMIIPNYLYLKGEPFFSFDEAKATWDYIVDNFTPECLGADPIVVN